jgi:hypothetical protein
MFTTISKLLGTSCNLTPFFRQEYPFLGILNKIVLLYKAISMCNLLVEKSHVP